MEVTSESSQLYHDMKCDQASFSLNDGDSNTIMLPGRKKNKRKFFEKLKDSRKGTPKLSNSQKRKLKKLEEEKEKELMLSKSMELLERYKIPEDAYALLKSSHSIGQVETKREKRLRAVQFSKVGVELKQSDPPISKSDGNNELHAIEYEESVIAQKEDFDPPGIVLREVPVETFVSLNSSQEPACDNEDFPFSDSEVAGSKSCKPMPEEKREFPSSLSDDVMQITNSADKASPAADFNTRSNLAGCVLQRTLTTPTVVHVTRPNEIEDKRKDLPIVMMEQEIMEAINYHSAVIICGETGCGKTTQVPQFLYEAGFGSSLSSDRRGIIGVTQPRRVAVLATAKRVAYELGVHLGREVGFQVRHDKRIGKNCSIKFMTDGILLREVQNDFLLKRYSVLILDEAHERSLNTDILIGMLSRVIQLRQDLYEKQQKMVCSGQSVSPENMIFPLRLVLMSATLRVEDFISGTKIFRDSPPVIEVPTRQFPVTLHFSKRTDVVDYIGQAYKKIMSIHKRLPQGGILVFVTGQREVEYLCKKLHKASKQLLAQTSKRSTTNEASVASEKNSTNDIDMKEIDEAFEIHGGSTNQQTDRFSCIDEDQYDFEEESDVSYDSETESDLEFDVDDGHSLDEKTPGDDGSLVNILGEDGGLASLKAAFEALSGKNSLGSDSREKQTIIETQEDPSCRSTSDMRKKEESQGPSVGALRVLPLYAMLPAAAQLHVFDEVKEGERLVVVATNVAETSLTIPGIKYVVDTGREKVKNYNSSNGMEMYEVQWISKASAAQRAGRAGRTGPGHCYRLYSSAVFCNTLPDFSCAEISKIPVDGVVLLMKSIGIDKVANFPFPTPPAETALNEAEHCLKALEALDTDGRLTLLGRAMAHYPMSPRHSRMLLTVIQIMRNVKSYARANLILGYAVAAAAALSLSNPFIMLSEASHSNKGDLDQEIVDKQEKLRIKKLKDTARASRAKFYNPISDALTIAYALQCFELSKCPVAFCNDSVLHLKTMEEMSKLRKQLLQLVFNQNSLCSPDQDFSWTHGTVEDIENAWSILSDKHPLLLNEEEVLGQAICAGWADRIAKRIRGTSGLSELDRKANAARYQACAVKETVFLHRRSCLSRSAPEFLVYNELLHTKRPYMHGATSVKPEWLVKYAKSLCTFSAPLTDPKPYYQPQTDQVLCWVVPAFGPHLWKLPLHSLAITDDGHRTTVFAYALLKGHVLPCLKSVRKFMSAPPGSILRPEAAGQRRVGNFLSKLKAMSVDSLAALREAWQRNPRVLHPEILAWFQDCFHDQFDKLWSQMLGEVLLQPQEHAAGGTKRGKKSKVKLV